MLVSCWHELGMYQSGGDHPSPLTFNEIKAYSDSAFKLEKSEVSLLAMMSKEYLREYNAASQDPNRKAPHEGEASIELIRKNVAKAFKAMFAKAAAK